MKLKCIIVDDEPMARKVLQEYIEDIDFLELVGKAENPVKANALLAQVDADLILLDINMPMLSGIEYLRTAASLPMVIITTAYAEYAIEGFELDVIDYLVKPFSFERFLKACNKAKEFHSHTQTPVTGSKSDHFFIKCDGRIEKVLYTELLYVEAMLNYVILHTDSRKMIAYLTIKSMVEQLPADIFLKVHKSYIINMSKIKSIEGNEISLGGAAITISQNLYESSMMKILSDRMIKR
jgi:DNA-binding LytR/AlgR family response regulator